MHRIFCATPFELEEEREAFYKMMAEFNENESMPKGILFVSLSLVPAMADKRVYQGVVNENIRLCRYYIQLLEDSWGPPQRNFERDYALASKFAADPNQPMQEVATFFKSPLLPHRVEPDIMELKNRLAAAGGPGAYEFDTSDQFMSQLRELLSRWLQSVVPAEASSISSEDSAESSCR